MLNPGLVAAFAVLAFGGIDGIIAKHITRRLGKHRYAIAVLGIGIVPMLIYLAAVGISNFSNTVVLLSFLSSIFLGIGYILWYKAIETQQITNVSLLGVVQPALIFLFGMLVLGNRVDIMEMLGVLAIFAGSLFVLSNGRMKINVLLVPAILANISWAVYWMIMNYAIAAYGSYSLPLIIARILAFVIIVAYSVLFGKIESTRRPYGFPNLALLLVLLLASGIMDSLVNILFGFVIKVGLVAIGSAIIAGTPILTAVLGRIIFKDRLTKLQAFGFLMAVAGSIAISIA